MALAKLYPRARPKPFRTRFVSALRRSCVGIVRQNKGDRGPTAKLWQQYVCNFYTMTEHAALHGLSVQREPGARQRRDADGREGRDHARHPHGQDVRALRQPVGMHGAPEQQHQAQAMHGKRRQPQ